MIMMTCDTNDDVWIIYLQKCPDVWQRYLDNHNEAWKDYWTRHKADRAIAYYAEKPSLWKEYITSTHTKEAMWQTYLHARRLERWYS